MLEAKGVTFSIDGKKLIEEISLQFKPGIVYGILGPNGSGKSTFLKNLIGIWKPSAGAVFWNGTDLRKLSRGVISRTVTLVPQNPQVHFDYTAMELVSMGRYPYCKHYSSKASSLLEWALCTVDAWHLRERSVLRLSSGERKRVYIARALVTESPILLLDEPTSSLDIKHQLEIWQLLKKLASQQKIVIVTNHDMASTERFCDQIAILNNGRCVSRGSCQEVFHEDLLSEVFGVKENRDALAKHYDIL